MRSDDPEAYRSEVLGEFRAGLSQRFDPEVLDDRVRPGAPELPPVYGVDYVAGVDVSGGRRDSTACAIAHRDAERVVVDAVREWPSPHDPLRVTYEVAELLRRYRVRRATGDRFAGEWPRVQFAKHNIRYELATLDRSALYLDVLPRVNAHTLELPEHRVLLGLERRTSRSGRDSVDHVRGAHDDVANAVAIAAHLGGKPVRKAQGCKFEV